MSAGTLEQLPVYIHQGCPTTLLGTLAPRVQVTAGRLACTTCGAWWDTPTVGAAPTGTNATDPGPRPKRTTRRKPS